jgi:DUF917 family protein
MVTLTTQDLWDILDGACILGAGGGGPLAIGREVIDKISASGKQVRLASLDEVSPAEAAAIVAGIGSPDSTNGFDVRAPSVAFGMLSAAYAKQFNTLFKYVLPGEIGAANTLLPMMAAVLQDLPVVDAAGGPRAMPALQNSTYAALGIPASPVIVGNSTLQLTLSVDHPAASDAASVDNAIRALIQGGVFTGSCGMALWGMNGAQMKGAAIRQTTTRALDLGRVLRAARTAGRDPVAAVVAFLGATLLVKGSITAVTEATSGGFEVGRVVVSQPGTEICIYNVNENLIAWNAGAGTPAAISPDMVCYLTADGQAFSNAEVMQHFKAKDEVAVFAVPVPASYRTPAIIASYAGELAEVGYPGPYVPLEVIAAIRSAPLA